MRSFSRNDGIFFSFNVLLSDESDGISPNVSLSEEDLVLEQNFVLKLESELCISIVCAVGAFTNFLKDSLNP